MEWLGISRGLTYNSNDLAMVATLVGQQQRIRVKCMFKGHNDVNNPLLLRQFPGQRPSWGQCEFLLDPEEGDYDWLVAYEDLSPLPGERFSSRRESLACHPMQTILITMEPSTIKVYGYDFIEQFGHVITSQEPWAVSNQRTILEQPGVRWYYGMSPSHFQTWDAMTSRVKFEKSQMLSTVCSNKQHGRYTLHAKRLEFTAKVHQAIPELDLFGRGVRPVDDKSQAVDPYKYHLVFENHIAPNYWTEKLADAFLGAALPFYVGCPNAADYFPDDSFISLDLSDAGKSIDIMRSAMASGAYERQLDAVLEARRRVLNDHNLFAMIARHVELRHDPSLKPIANTRVFSRHALRRVHPRSSVRYAWEQFRVLRKARQQLQLQLLAR